MNNFRFAFEFPLGAKDTESAAYLLSLVDDKRLQKIDWSVLLDSHPAVSMLLACMLDGHQAVYSELTYAFRETIVRPKPRSC